MSETTKFSRWDAFLVGMLLAFVFTFLPMTFWGLEKWHRRTCHEQFNQAATPRDSLTVIVNDSYCNLVLDR
jgi:hypothetical protein